MSPDLQGDVPLRVRVIELVSSLAGGDTNLLPETSLAAIGFDSLGIVQLLVELEDSFAIAIPDDELTAANFRTVGTLLELMERVVGASSK